VSGNAASWFVERHIDEGRADKPAFLEVAGEQRELTYGQLNQQSALFADAILGAGVAPGERVAMFVLDQVEFPVIFWGAMKAGVIPVALNTLLATDVYRTILEDSGACMAFVSSELVDVVLPAAKASSSVRQIVVIGGDVPESTTGWATFMQGADAANTREPVSCTDDDIAFWLYSSGSTGAPKGVRHKHKSLKITCDTYGAQVLGIREDDRVFSAAKLFFAYGLGNGMSFPMAVGATAYLFNGRPTPDSVTEILERLKPTIYFGVPTLYAALLQQWDSKGSHPDAPLRLCVSAGEALPADIGQKWKAMWGVDILDGVGSTEMLHIFLSNAPGDVQYGTSGVPVPGYEVRLVDEAGDEVAVGALGELLVRGESSAFDYWNQPEKSSTTFEGEWTRTGDKYEIDEAGRFIYCGRTDDMFKVSGIWVSPFEVEQALIEFPAVLEAAVVSHPDESGLEKPKAYVVLRDGQDEAALEGLTDHVKDKIGKWKYPRWVEVMETLPKTATGKIQRFKLRGPS